MKQRVQWLLVGVLLASSAASVAGASAALSPAARERTVRWLALGDSFSSGEGIPGAAAGNQQLQGKDTCQRANGDNTDAKAYSVVAVEELQGQPPVGLIYERPFFVACTGAITDDNATQLAEMRAQVPTELQQWDVASLSYGGNNVLFSSVIEDCLDIKDPWGAVTYEGCSTGEQRLRERIEMLAGTRTIIDREFDGVVTLPELYDQVAAVMQPGGHVIVVGYPHLIEVPDRWASWLQRRSLGCQGVLKDDVRMLRSVTGYLNEQIGLAVLAAGERWAAEGISFHFVDISTEVYETSADPSARHGLCADDQWINGLTLSVKSGDIRKERSFHPTQEGHTATGRFLADLLRTFSFPPACDAAQIGADLGEGPVEVIEGLCRNGWAYIDTDGLGDSQRIVRHDGTAWTVYTYFPSAFCPADALAAGAPPEIVNRVGWGCFAASDPGVISPARRSGSTLVDCDAEVSADVGEAIFASCSGDWATGQQVAYVEGGCADCDGVTLFNRVAGRWTESGGCLYRSVIIASSKGCSEMWQVPREVLCEVWGLNSDLGALWETGCPPWKDSLERAQTESCTYYGELDPTDDAWGPAFGTCKKGSLVQQVQDRLLELGYEIDSDGFFGPQSARAIAQFQQAQGLTVSAVIDPPSITALLG